MNNLNTWYKCLGSFLISLGILTAALFVVRFSFLKSTGFVIFLDDFLTIGLANIFLFPCGIWLLYIGSHPYKYVKVNKYPLALISISPMSMLIISLLFLLMDVTRFSVKSTGEAYTLVIYFSIIAICAVSFMSGNMLLLYQIVKAKKTNQIGQSAVQDK